MKVAVVVPPAEAITAESEIEAWVRIGRCAWRSEVSPVATFVAVAVRNWPATTATGRVTLRTACPVESVVIGEAPALSRV